MYIRGVVPPLVTPLTPDERLDARALAKVIDHVISGGVGAIFVAGTMGEFFGLTARVRDELVERSREAIAGRVPLLVGVGESCTSRARDLAAKAGRSGADLVVAIAPYYYHRYTQSEVADHLRRIRDASRCPVVIYENPHTTHYVIEIETVMRLADEGGFAGLKDSSGDWGRFRELTRLILEREDFFILQGEERRSAAAVLAGADGFVPGMGNIAPAVCRRLYDAASSGDAKGAGRLQRTMDSLAGLYGERPIPAAKYALSLMGITGPTSSAPQALLNAAEKAVVRRVLAKHGLIAAAKAESRRRSRRRGRSQRGR